jgi:hypothetical protein
MLIQIFIYFLIIPVLFDLLVGILHGDFSKNRNNVNKNIDKNYYRNLPKEEAIRQSAYIDDDIIQLYGTQIDIARFASTPIDNSGKNRTHILSLLNRIKSFSSWWQQENMLELLNYGYYIYTMITGDDYLCWYCDNSACCVITPDKRFLGMAFDEYLEKRFNISLSNKEEIKNQNPETISQNINDISNQKELQIFKEEKINKEKKKRYRRKRKKHFLKFFFNLFITFVQNILLFFSLKIKNIFNSLKHCENVLYNNIILLKEKNFNKKQIKKKRYNNIVFNKNYIKYLLKYLYVYFFKIIEQLYNTIDICFIEEKIFLKYQVCLN